MNEISVPQMKLLHVLAKEAGLSHDEISASARQTYGVLSLRDLTVEQAREMIDGLMPEGSKPMPEAPKSTKPLNVPLPRRRPVVQKPKAAPVSPPRPAAIVVPAPAPRPFGTRPPIKPPAPVAQVLPPPVRIRLPSDPGAPAPERQTGGFGRLSPPPPRAAPAPAAPKQQTEFKTRRPGFIDPSEIPF
jgi:hypothetical protein